jgi:hypothetical protein
VGGLSSLSDYRDCGILTVSMRAIATVLVVACFQLAGCRSEWAVVACHHGADTAQPSKPLGSECLRVQDGKMSNRFDKGYCMKIASNSSLSSTARCVEEAYFNCYGKEGGSDCIRPPDLTPNGEYYSDGHYSFLGVEDGVCTRLVPGGALSCMRRDKSACLDKQDGDECELLWRSEDSTLSRDYATQSRCRGGKCLAPKEGACFNKTGGLCWFEEYTRDVAENNRVFVSRKRFSGTCLADSSENIACVPFPPIDSPASDSQWRPSSDAGSESSGSDSGSQSSENQNPLTSAAILIVLFVVCCVLGTLSLVQLKKWQGGWADSRQNQIQPQFQQNSQNGGWGGDIGSGDGGGWFGGGDGGGGDGGGGGGGES